MAIETTKLIQKVKGIIHLVVSPFDDNGELDEKALVKCVDAVAKRLNSQDAVFVTTASTGEFYAMTDEECKTVIRLTTETLAGRFPVFAGTGRSGTRRTIKLSQYAQSAGADGVMIVNPYYHTVTEEGLYRHFKEIAENIDIGIMIYNNPGTSKLWIPPELMAKISKIKNIIADKETTADAAKYYWMQKLIDPEDMVIVCGISQLVYPFFAVFGCPGFVTEFANFAPDIPINLYKAARERDFDKMAELTDKMSPYYRFRSELCRKRSSIPTIVSPFLAASDLPLVQSIVKEAMNLTGLPGGTVRDPVERLTEQEKKQLGELLKDMSVQH